MAGFPRIIIFKKQKRNTLKIIKITEAVSQKRSYII